MAEVALIQTIGIMIVAAAAVILIARRLNVPTIVLYILTGLALGPLFGVIAMEPDTVDEVETAEGALAIITNLGVALLLFLVGMELSIDKIRDVGGVSILAGIGQVVLIIFFGTGLCLLLQFSVLESIFIATALTNSSTVLAVKLLEQKGQTDEVFGHIAIGLNLVKDMSLIVILTILVAFAAPGAGEEPTTFMADLGRLALTFSGAAAMLLIALVASRHVLPRIIKLAGGSAETQLIWSLCWCFAFVAFADAIGLSAAIGAFLAGVSLAQLREADELRRHVHPLMNFFLAIFFVAIGARMEFGDATAHWHAAMAITLFVLLINPAICMVFIAKAGYGERTSFLSSTAMGQISELSFVFAAVGLGIGMIDAPVASMITVVGLLSIAASSYMILFNEQLYGAVQKTGILRIFGAYKNPEPPPQEDVLRNHIVIVGMNDLGRDLAIELHERGETVLAIDNDTRKLQDLPCRTMLGNIEYQSVMEDAALSHAKFAVSALHIEETNNLFAYNCKKLGVPVAIHAFDGSVIPDLKRMGVDYLIDSKAQGSVQLATQLHEKGVVSA